MKIDLKNWDLNDFNSSLRPIIKYKELDAKEQDRLMADALLENIYMLLSGAIDSDGKRIILDRDSIINIVVQQWESRTRK